jgi:twinkle protein
MGYSHNAPCPECNSRDNVGVYSDGTYCFGCGHSTGGGAPTGAKPPMRTATRLEMSGSVQAIKDRRISKETCKKFGVTAQKGADGTVINHWYPHYSTETGELVATKKRICADKDFRWSGDRTEIGLFGQSTCRGSGKFITITEGECDALAVSEMFDNKWDVVSIVDGIPSAARDIKRSLEWLEGYDNIVLCFDNDKKGQEGVDAVKDLFSPNKLKICSLPVKDAGAMLEQGKIREFTKAWWDSPKYMPAGIITASETWDAVVAYRDTPSTPYPWKGLNSLLLGQRTKEVVVWAAETGVGKTQTMREVIDHIVTTTPQQVGCLMLEESVAKSMLGWMSFHAGRPLHKELDKIPDEELRKYWELASAGDRFVLLDHKGWGSDIEKLKSRVRYMAKSLGCKTIILDHLHIALSSVAGASGDWSGIDELVTQLCVLAQECDICLHLVSHVSGERSLRGSKGISKLVDALIFLERDKHHDDPEIANTTCVVVDKNRFAGDVGTACYLRYDKYTGRMTECQKPETLEVPDEF